MAQGYDAVDGGMQTVALAPRSESLGIPWEERIVTDSADERRDQLTAALQLLTTRIDSLIDKLDEVALAIENQPSAFSAELGMWAEDDTVMTLRELPGALTELADRLPDQDGD